MLRMSEGQTGSAVQSASNGGGGGGGGNPGTRVKNEILPRLLTLLSPVIHSWDVFVQQIGVPADKVLEIKTANVHTSPSWLYTCLTEALKWWVANHHSPTYEVIIAVLDPEVGQATPVMNRTLASEVKEFMAKEGHSAHLSDDFTQTNDLQIRGKFAALLEIVKTKLQDQLEAEKIETNFRQYILDLYPGMHKSYIPVSSKIVEIFEAMRVNNLLSYYNYYALEQIIKHFGGDDSELTSKMHQYKSDWSAFQLATKIRDYFPHVRSVFPSECDESVVELRPKRKHSYFKVLSVKLDECVTDRTLDYLEELWNSLSSILVLPPLYLLLDSVIMNSVLVEWLIPTSKVPEAIEKAKQSADVFRKHPILKVTIDDECVYEVRPADQKNGSDVEGQREQPLPAMQTNALQLRIRGQEGLSYFNYAWSSITGKQQAVNWMDIADHDINELHIQCYQMKPDDDIQFLSKTLNNQATAAVILINHKNSYQIDPHLLPESKKWEIPIIVVTSEVGQNLNTILTKYGRDVQAKIEPFSIQTGIQARSVGSSLETSNTPETHSARDIAANIERALRPTEGQLVIASENYAVFQSVMFEFYIFETTEQKKETEQRVFIMLMRTLKSTFQKDFLLYIALAYRAHFVKPAQYLSAEVKQFVDLCIEQFEKLDTVHVANALNGFFERKDFNFRKGSQQRSVAEVSAFWFLEHAFDALMSERKDKPHQYCIYPTMLWITTYLSFCAKRLPEEGDDSCGKWRDYFLKDAHKYSLDDNNIQGLLKALNLGQQLKLPWEYTFGTNLMGQLLAPCNDQLRPFHQQTDAICVLGKCEDPEYFYSEEEFRKHIVIRLKESYMKSMKKTAIGTFLKDITTDTRPQAGVWAGLRLLDAMLSVTTKKWESRFDESFKQWLLLLVNLIELMATEKKRDEEVQGCFMEILSKRHYVVERFHSYIVECTGECLKKFTVSRFYYIYNSLPDTWPSELLNEYLEGCNISRYMKISDPIWKLFFEMIVERFPGAANQQQAHNFLIKVAEHYLNCESSEEKDSSLITDMLKFGVSGLFSIDSSKDEQAITEFENDLQGFIKRLKSSPILQIDDIMACLSSESNSFQEVVLSAVLKEIITESSDLCNPSLSTAIDTAVGTLTGDQSWIQNKLSLKQKFCFNFINECCARVSTVINKFTAISWDRFYRHSSLIGKVCNLYRHYSESSQVRLCDALPVAIAKNPPSSSVRKYFEWLQIVHSMLAEWESRLYKKRANYDEILWYLQNWQNICNLADAVVATSLILSSDMLEALNETFLNEFEVLNQLLLKYIPGDPKAGWCSVISVLSGYGTDLPQDLHSRLSQYVVFPDETKKTTASLTLPSPTNTPLSEHICLRLSKKLDLASLGELVAQLTKFLSPISPDMDMLVYFKLRPSALFSTYMNHVLNMITDTATGGKPVTTIDHIQMAVEHTKDLLMKVLKGTANYGEIIAEDQLNLEELHVEEEFGNLLKCRHFSQYGDAGLTGIKSLLKLVQFVKPVLKLEEVFEQYGLKYCLNDPDFKEIRELALTLLDSEERTKITFDDAKRKWRMVRETLCLTEDASPKCLDLFFKIADSAEFYKFLQEKELIGTEGYNRFQQKVDIITRHQELNEYQEIVLNHLFAAFAFIAPIMDPSHDSLHSLMSAVAVLGLPEDLSQLDTVRNNMYLIQFWFSQSEDTFENASRELDGILNSGRYCIEATSPESFGANSLQLVIKYQLVSTSFSEQPAHETQKAIQEISQDQQVETQEQLQSKEKVYERTKTMEQINDFVHKLGLLKGEDQRVKDFLQLNEGTYKLLEVCCRLRQLGHPKYSRKEFKETVQCSALLPDVNRKVSEAVTVLETWREEVASLHRCNKWLLFFRVPKLMVLYKVLTADNPSVSSIIQEVGFLFKRDAHTSANFKDAVEIAIEAHRPNTCSENSPMDIVGSFLQDLFSQEDIKKCSLPVRYTKKHINSPLQPINLYNAAGYTQSQIVGLILGLYDGPPEAFEILRCKPTTTEQELSLFMKRVTQHPRIYLVLEVNILPYQLQEILLQLYLQLKHQLLQNMQTFIYFIETAPSVLREVSYLEYKEERISAEMNRALTVCEETESKDWSCIELVYSKPGNGKTHYIHSKMKHIPESHQVTVAVNEAFTSVNAIERLRTLPRDASNCAIFFNFTILPPADGTADTEREHHQKHEQLMKEVGWFFFDLLILRYVEDPATGISFHLPAGLLWELYIEVPSRATSRKQSFEAPPDFLECFKKEVPTLALLGSPVCTDTGYDYCINEDVQLVCKYLRAYDNKTIDTYDIRGEKFIKFSVEPDLSDEECKQLLHKYMPPHVKESKITQKLFVQYMKRRCTFLDNLSAFNYNPGCGEYIEVNGETVKTDTRQLGSTVMKTMLKEVTDFCDPSSKERWSQKAHQQLIYDFTDGGASLGLISLLPDQLTEEDKGKFSRMGIEIPSLKDLHSRALLDKYLSRALNVPLSKDGHLSPIDKREYVLTLDYTLKMLNIHERYECGIPVIIEGETGVGKTALIEMLSELWNHSWVAQWDRDKDRIADLMQRKIGDLEVDAIETLYSSSAGETITEETLNTIAQLPDSKYESGKFYSALNDSLLKLEGDPKFVMLDFKLHDEKLSDAFSAIKNNKCSKTTAHLLYILFSATVKSVFHKKNIHADLQPEEMEQFFEEVFAQANELQYAYTTCDAADRPNFRVPSVIAYLDEINTASCLGLFKEIMVDRNINGKPIPPNVFIIASCNPHRGDVLTVMHEKKKNYTGDSWLKGTYYVRQLHPTLEYLKWDYGSLDQQQEEEYVYTKMQMLNWPGMSSEDVSMRRLTALIVESQQKMRTYASEQLQTLKISKTDAWLCAKSSVSQRDIQRVFTFYQWLMKTYVRLNPHKEHCEHYHRRAVMVSLGLVYFMRLNGVYRGKYRIFLDTDSKMAGEVSFSQAYEDELRWYINGVKLPPNIAKTNGLKENVFAIIACTMTRTPLIIVGDPGSSKTLSFNIVTANFKGKRSKMEIYRETDVFLSLDPHFYQCSHRTTSNEVENTFRKAINRQNSFIQTHLPMMCVVFMDEAGLPEEKFESLKVLHYYLDRPKVSFVAISNHVLDASKTNRAVSLFRPKPTDAELFELGKVSIVQADHNPLQSERDLLNHFCKSYNDVVKEFGKLFGLRDFIYFVTYIRCHNKTGLLNSQLILEALERNFNGSKRFMDVCNLFFDQIPGISTGEEHHRSILDILRDSRAGITSDGDDIHSHSLSEVRYKLIIEPSEDGSLVRLLFTYGVLQRENTRLYICSDFPGDSQSRISTVVQIMHSVAVGHTILMYQTDKIHESFYDLFNQRFRTIKDPERGPSYYTNVTIGAHSKPCRVNPAFQCVVVIKESEVEDTPPPFLSRFEKYHLTHQSLLETVFKKLPCNLRIVFEAARNKAAEFISCVKQPHLYGCAENTLDSLMLTLLPPPDTKYTLLENQPSYCKEVDDDSENILLKTLLKMLRNNAGFLIPQFRIEEIEEDAVHIFKFVLKNSDIEKELTAVTHESAAALVNEALIVLHQDPQPADEATPSNIYTDALMVIVVLVQWLVNYLCKKLMQLVPPEALPVHCSGIPTMYFRNYLKFQEHFSLKELVKEQLNLLKGNDWKRSVCPTKLLCFTRSSSLIHQLPADYPAAAIATKPVTNYDNLVREHIFTELELLMICKVSLARSQGQIERLLGDFVTSRHQVLLLITNMQEINSKKVNHLRIMIEEAENQMGVENKLFILLLHFPPVMFFKPCYPTLFLQGWSHHYLDTISSGTLTREGVKSVVDIKKCFYHCLFPDSISTWDEDGQMFSVLSTLLPEAIPVIASRVAFICKGTDATAVVMNASQRTEVLQKLFTDNFEDTNSEGEKKKNIGQVLTEKFCKYWTPQLMVEQIEKVSRSVYGQDSTLNITDSIQSIVRSAFFDFLVYMFNKMNKDQNMCIILDYEECSPVIEQLFLALLREITIPELEQLKAISATLRPLPVQRKALYIPRFPFFKDVCEVLEKVIDESKEEVNQKSNILEGPQPGVRKRTKQQMEKLYIEAVMKRMQEKVNSCLDVTVMAMNNEDGNTLWRCYFDDFVHYKLHLGFKPPPLIIEIINNVISPLIIEGGDALTRIASLHVHCHVHHVDLAKITRMLMPISMMENLSPTKDKPIITLRSVEVLMHEVKPTPKMPPTFRSLIITTLFNSAVSSMDAITSENLQCWYRSYHSIMSMPAMVESILANLTSLTEPQLSIMNATYLVMQCCLDSPSQRGQEVFKALYSKHCGQSVKCTHLRDVVDAGLKAMEITPQSLSIHGGESCLQSFMEGVFSFFFSKHRAFFTEDDCNYFFEIANQQYNFCGISTRATAPTEHCTSMNIFKLYLARILGEPEHDHDSQNEEGKVITYLNAKHRKMVGKVLVASSDVGSPGPYIPTFYQLNEKIHIDFYCESIRNALMQQPLAHLYFLTVLEHLHNRRYHLNSLVQFAVKITKILQEDSTPKPEKVVLFIEKQAVVQMIICQLATYFDPKDPSKIHSLFTTHLNVELNHVLAEESMGGSNTCVSWHALTLAMHLHAQIKSVWELIRLLSDNHSTLVKDFNTVKPLQLLIQPLDVPKSEAHLFPFLKNGSSSELAYFYQAIRQAMLKVRESDMSEDVGAFIKLASDSYNSERKMKFTTSSGNSLLINQRKAFRMLLWLCTYNEFYIQKISSKALAEIFDSKLMGIIEPEFISLLKTFIYPECMILCPEATPPPDENAQRLRLTESMRVVPLPPQAKSEMVDPLGALFNTLIQDPFDTELRHSMANMVAIVLACEPRSNHLWYHMFAADGLSNSHMTGFMYPDKISENLLYDCGVELSSDGLYGRPDYLPHATRGTLNLQSLYLILWANFSAFCMAMVTQPDAQEKICGPIISPWQHVRHYCVQQLRLAWFHMGNKLNLSTEEQSFFIMQCMEGLLEVSISQPHLLHNGRFESLEELDSYERMWHSSIFERSLQNIHSKFAEHCRLHESKLFQSIRCLETYYPHFPTHDEFSQTLLSSVEISSPQNDLYVLSIFTLEYHRLQAAGALLPDLLQLYHWIHNELAYLVTYDDAQTCTIQEVIERESEKCEGPDLIHLYERVKDGYKMYVEVIGHSIGAGACANINRKGRVNKIEDSTKFIHFLSAESDDEQWEGSDLLYFVIDDIVNFHNSFLQKVFHAVAFSEHSNLRKYFPEQLKDFEDECAHVHPTEVNEDIMIIPARTLKAYEIEELLHLVRSRHLQCTEQGSGDCPFDLHRLQIDVIQAYLVGKSLISQSPEAIRIPFKFKIEQLNTLAIEGADLNLSVISHDIKEEYKLPLEEKDASELECEFHSADYDTLAKVVRGLRVATEYLKSEHQTNKEELKSKKLSQFLLLVYKKPKESEDEMLEKIGFRHLSPSQLACLQTLKLPYLYSTLELFVNWITDGMYDFHQLPLVMKRHLNPEDKQVLDMLDANSKGISLLQEIQDLLVHSESHLKDNIAKYMQKPIIVILREVYDEVKNADLFPSTILCQHYVALRVMVRRKLADLQGSMASMGHKQQEDQQNRWIELVDDLWKSEEKLKHLWDIAKPYNRLFEFDPAGGEYGLYGYQDGMEIEETDAGTESKKEEQPEPEVTSPSIPTRKEQLKEVAKTLSVADMTEFLKTDPKLEKKYTTLFQENQIDGILLFSCEKDDLKDLGITNGFDRTKIMTKFEQHLQSKLSH